MLLGCRRVEPNGREEEEVVTVEETRTPGRLVLVATPIGNLGDLSGRARELFEVADAIYCEDTRHSRVLFSAVGVTTGGRLHSLHEHNEVAEGEKVVDRVRNGELVVLVSDAGTPGISDPGARVVAAVVAAGLTVSTAPGPSAVVAALSVSGLPTERFVMEGFLPRKAGERARWFEGWAREERTVVFYESPVRLASSLAELAALYPGRRVAVARELTKMHEEVLRGTLAEVAARVAAGEVRGEVAVVLEGAPSPAAAGEDVVRAALVDQFAAGASTRDAVEVVTALLGAARRDVYEIALRVREGGPR
jgi:16S rRNA (cytidine1402-2'-O)-methyltransferase